MVLDDFVMLGKTVPEVSSDGREMVCTAGYSLELRKPIRIYPLARHDCPARWSLSRVPLERNAKDSRDESWKIKGNRDVGPHERINNVIDVLSRRVSPAVQKEIIQALTVRSLQTANKELRSICVISPENIPRMDLEAGEKAEMAPTPDMFAPTALPVAERFKWHPRLRFTDQDGSHDLMLRDWGCYELMRKHGDEAALEIGNALNLSSAPPLLCGNINRFRNAWLVISVFSSAIHTAPSVFDQQFTMFGDDQQSHTATNH